MAMRNGTMVLFTCSFLLGCEATRPHTDRSTHYFRDHLLPNEGQSCPDISDHRTKLRQNVEFCTVTSPQPDISTTLSFWGWDHKKGPLEKSVQLYSVSTSGNETFLLEIDIPKKNRSHGGKVQWHHREFTLSKFINSTETISELKLYYSVQKGHKERLNLRDVWIRPTSVNAGNRPSKSCNDFIYIYSLYFVVLIGSLYPLAVIFIIIMSIDMINKRCFSCTSPIIIDYSITVYQAVAFGGMFDVLCLLVMRAFVSPYPYLRCKDDDFFIGILIFSGVLILIRPPVMYYWVKNELKSLRRTRAAEQQHREFIRRMDARIAAMRNETAELNLTLRRNRPGISEDEIEMGDIGGSGGGGGGGQVTELNVIEIATNNSKLKKYPNRKVYGSAHNECTICMLNYGLERPGVVTECGHVWCSECISDICKMRQPNITGVCPTCRSTVHLSKLTLFNTLANSAGGVGGLSNASANDDSRAANEADDVNAEVTIEGLYYSTLDFFGLNNTPKA